MGFGHVRAQDDRAETDVVELLGDSQSAEELMSSYFTLLTRMEKLDFIRTRNSPVGDVAEKIVQQALGGDLYENSKRSVDLLTKTGERIQVKARATLQGSQTFGVFRSFDFDTAIFIIFDPYDGSLLDARSMAAEDVEEISRFSSHTNGRNITVKIVKEQGRSVLEQMSAAYFALRAPDPDSSAGD